MVAEALRRLFAGFGVGGVLTLIVLTVFVINDTPSPMIMIWSSLLGSMLIGGYFSVASFIFEQESWSPLKQLIIHFGLSVIVYSIVAMTVGWLPLRLMPILGGLLIFMAMYMIFWFGFRYYYKKQAEALNQSVKK